MRSTGYTPPSIYVTMLSCDHATMQGTDLNEGFLETSSHDSEAQ